MSTGGIRAGRAFVELGVNDRITQGLRNAQAKMNAFANGLKRTGLQVGAMGLGMAVPIGMAVKQFASFDDAMRAVGAVSTASATELQSMTAAALELGRTTSYTSTEVANLMGELGRAGFSPDQINNMTGAVLNLARATGTDAVLASGIMAATLRQFNMQATDAARVSDVLTVAANSTFTTVEQLGEALAYAGPVAADLGMSFEATAAILGTLGNVGIQGSSAGTALRRLATISAGAGDELERIFGIKNTDPAGQFKGLVQILDEIGTATANMSVTERTAKMEEAFGLLGITSASVLSKTAGGVTKLQAALDGAAGASETTAASMDAGIGGAFRRLLSAADGVVLAFGGQLESSISSVADAFSTALGSLTEWIGENQTAVQVIALTATGLLALGASLIATAVAVKAMALGVAAASMAMTAFSAVAGIVAAGFKTIQIAALLFHGTMLASQGAALGMVAAMGALNAAQAISPGITAAVSAAYAGLGTVLTGVATVASAAWGLFAGVLTGSIAPVGLLTAVTGGLSAAWAAVAGAAATAWASMIGPLLPFLGPAAAIVAVVGALVAVAGIAASKAGLFATAWEGAKSVLMDLWSIVSDTFGGIASAMADGQYAQAASILWAGVKAAFWTGVDAAINAVSYMFNNFLSGASAFGRSFLSTLWGVFKSIPSLLLNALALANPVAMLARWMRGDFSGMFDSLGNAAAGAVEELKRLRAETDRIANNKKSKQSLADQAKELKELRDEVNGIKPPKDTQSADGTDPREGMTPQQAARYNANQAETKNLRDQLAKKNQEDSVAKMAGDTKPDDPTAESRDEATKSITDRIAALKAETDEIEKSARASERDKLALMGATDPQLNALDAAHNAKAAASLQKDIDDRITALQEEAYAVKHGQEVLEQFKLAQRRATVTQLEALNVARKQADQAKKQKDLQDRGDGLNHSMRSAFEVFRDELASLNELRNAGTISDTTYARKQRELKGQFGEQVDTPEERDQQLLDERARLSEEVDNGTLTAEQAGNQFAFIRQLMSQFETTGKTMDAKAADNVGTFSGFAAGRMGGGANRAAEQTADNTKQILENQKTAMTKPASPALTFGA